MNNPKGFSLFEFLTSLFLVFVMATIGYTQYVTSWENAKQTAIISNMYTVQLCAEDFCTMADGMYPGGINTMVCEVSSVISDSSVFAGANKPPYPLRSLIPATTINPIDSTHDAIRNGLAHKPSGCIYYFGSDTSGKQTNEGTAAVGYKITAMGPYRPITLVLTSSGLKKGSGNEKK